jgi:hypothetical protein
VVRVVSMENKHLVLPTTSCFPSVAYWTCLRSVDNYRCRDIGCAWIVHYPDQTKEAKK